MSEKTILAYFHTPDQAKQALEKLKALRLGEYAIERFDGYAGNGAEHSDAARNAISGESAGLPKMTPGEGFDTLGAKPDAGVGGVSYGRPDNRTAGRDILLAATVDEADYEHAMQIVQSEGAL